MAILWRLSCVALVALAVLAPNCVAQQGVELYLPGREAERVLELPLGGTMQKAVLENGSLALADSTNWRIVLLSSEGELQVPVRFSNAVDSRTVAAMPGNKLAYCVNGEMRVYDVATGQVQVRGSIPQGDWIQALGSDGAGHIYAATGKYNLYRFDPEGRRDLMVSNLPFGSGISDLTVGRAGEVYVAGSTQVVKVQSGAVNVISSGLNPNTVWVAARPDGKIYINESTKHLQLYDPVAGTIASITLPPTFTASGDILAPSDDEIVFQAQMAFFRFSLGSGAVTTLLSIDGNSKPFTVAGDGNVYLGTMWRKGLMNSRLARLSPYGPRKLEYLDSVNLPAIQAIATDARGRLCLIEGDELKRVEADGSLTTFSKYVPPNRYGLAMGSDEDWFVTAHNNSDSVKIYRVREGATTGQLVVTIDNTLLPGATMADFSAALTPNGELAMVVSASKSGGIYQRVYRANADGSSLREVVNMDSTRSFCPVDIAVAPNSDLYVLGCSHAAPGTHNAIFRIEPSNLWSEVARFVPGTDAGSIAVDDQGALWFTASDGIYRVPEAPLAAKPKILSVLGVLHSASWNTEITSNTWISIFGTNLYAGVRSWTGSDFVGGRLPTQLDGAGVTIGGKPAYISYASPTQLNVLVPDLGAGTYDVQAFTPMGTGNKVSVRIQQFAPALFKFDAGGGRYAAAVHADGAYVGDPAVLTGLSAVPAKPGEIISLYGSGFGPVTGNPDTGALISSAYNLANTVTLRIGGVDAPVRFAGLVGAGLVQLNVEIPKVADGDQPVTGTIAGTPLRGTAYLTVARP